MTHSKKMGKCPQDKWFCVHRSMEGARRLRQEQAATPQAAEVAAPEAAQPRESPSLGVRRGRRQHTSPGGTQHEGAAKPAAFSPDGAGMRSWAASKQALSRRREQVTKEGYVEELLHHTGHGLDSIEAEMLNNSDAAGTLREATAHGVVRPSQVQRSGVARATRSTSTVKRKGPSADFRKSIKKSKLLCMLGDEVCGKQRVRARARAAL